MSKEVISALQTRKRELEEALTQVDKALGLFSTETIPAKRRGRPLGSRSKRRAPAVATLEDTVAEESSSARVIEATHALAASMKKGNGATTDPPTTA